MPDITLLGAGPVGSLIAGALLHNGIPFAWVVRNAERRVILRSGALSLRCGDERPLYLPLDPKLVFESADDVFAADSGGERLADGFGHGGWLILAVKAQQALPLLASLSPYPGGKALVVANGLHEGPFHLGVLYGGAYIQRIYPSKWKEPEYRDREFETLITGEVNRITIGALGEVTDFSDELLSLLDAPWLTVETTLDIEPLMWRKAALNCVVNPLTALLDVENGALAPLLGSPLVRGLLDEACGAAWRASGKRLMLLPDELAAELAELLTLTAHNSSSMREDLRAGRETEVELLNLKLAQLGRAHEADCPLNEALGRMLQTLSR